MSLWKGISRDQFIANVRGLSRRELTDMMRQEGAKMPACPPKMHADAVAGMCFDVLGAGPSATPSEPERTDPPRYEVRARGSIYRRRCGYMFSNQPESFPFSAFSRAEWEQLKADPFLEVRDLVQRVRPARPEVK